VKLSSESVTQQALAATAPPTPVWDQIQWDLTDHPQAKATIFKNNIDTAPFHVVRDLNAYILKAEATFFKNNIDTAPFHVV
jgi:hypothetical protein